MADLCTACLCSGRKLMPLNDAGFYYIYSQILNEISVYNMTGMSIEICWECAALIKKIYNFRNLVKSSYLKLLQCVNGTNETETTRLSPRTSNLKSQLIVSISYPDIKEEIDCLQLDEGYGHYDCNNVEVMKCNNDDHVMNSPVMNSPVMNSPVKNEEHCEPETFVNEIKNERKIKKKKKVVKEKQIKSKERFKPKIKSKKSTRLKKVKLPIPEPEFDDESCPEFDEHLIGDDDGDDYEIKRDLDDKVVEKDIEIEAVTESKKRLKPKIKTKKSTRLKKVKLPTQEPEFGDESCPEFDEHLIGDDDGDDYEIKRDLDDELVEKDIEIEAVTEVKIKRNGVKTRTREIIKLSANGKPECSECGKVFSSKKTLRYHKNVLHKGNNRYPCPRCGKVYQWKSNLGRHLRSHKARDSGELYCKTCDKRFASVATYRQHLSISKQHVSENEFSYVCNECGKKFVNKTRLRDHIDWEHLQKIKFRCQLCNKPFKCHTSLYIHMKNVHKNKGLKDNLCHVCGKSYQNRAKLRYHIVAMHTTETPYQCEQCNAAFGWYSSLYRHVREVHYKMKLQPNRSKKQKRRPEPLMPNLAIMPPLPPLPPIPTHGPNMLANYLMGQDGGNDNTQRNMDKALVHEK